MKIDMYLPYLDSIINHGEKDFEDYYNEKLHKVKSSILEKYMNSVDKVKPIKSKLPYLEEFDAFSIRPLSCDKSEIEKYEDVFLDKASFHTTGLYKSKKDSLIDDSITFEYVTETFHSVYRITPNVMSTTVTNYCYDDEEKYEQIYHFNNNDIELIRYYNNFEDKDYIIEFDVTNSNYIEKDKEAEDMTDVEYDKLYEIVRKFISELNDTKNIFLTSPKHKKRSLKK